MYVEQSARFGRLDHGRVLLVGWPRRILLVSEEGRNQEQTDA